MPISSNNAKSDSGRLSPDRALIPIDDVIDNLPFIVRRDHRIVAGFARLKAATDWAADRSYSDESLFTIHTRGEIIETYRDGEAEGDK
jgi:hypothetical protein